MSAPTRPPSSAKRDTGIAVSRSNTPDLRSANRLRPVEGIAKNRPMTMIVGPAYCRKSCQLPIIWPPMKKVMDSRIISGIMKNSMSVAGLFLIEASERAAIDADCASVPRLVVQVVVVMP